MRESVVSAKRFLLYVWREIGAVRNACPSRGRAVSTRKRRSGRKDARSHLEVRR